MQRPLDMERKTRRLAAAGGPGSGGRVLRAFGGRSLLATLLLEIDETILPRSLRATNDAGGEICLDVANRRLVQLRQSRRGASARDAVVVQPDPQSPDEIAALREILEGFVDGSTALRLRIEAQPGAAAPGAFGVSARRLSTEWEAPMDPPPGLPLSDALDALLLEHRHGIVAWQSRQDGHTDCGGDAEYFDALGPLSQTLEKRALGVSRALSDLSHGSCVFTLDRYGEAGLGVIFAALDGTMVTLLVQPGDLMRIATGLREVLHGWQPTLAA